MKNTFARGSVSDLDFIESAIQNDMQNQICSQLHPGDCNMKALQQFMLGVKGVFKIYLFVHIIPLIISIFRKQKKNTREQVKKALHGLAKSLLMAGCTLMIARRVICLITKYINYSYKNNRFSIGMGGIAILFESPSRQIQISLFNVAKGWETVYLMLKRRNMPIRIPWGNLWINGVALALISYAFMSQPEVFRSNYKKVLGKILSDI